MHREPGAYKLDKRGANRWVGAAVTALTLAVFALYMHTLGKQSLWFDEGLSVAFAARPLPQVMHTLIYEDLHPPLYYVLLHFWMKLAGNSEWAVRMPSAFAATLLVPLAFAVVAEVWGKSETCLLKENGVLGRPASTGIAAAMLVASSPFIAYYAQETRMYSLAAALALATTWAFLRAIRCEGQRWWLTFSGLLAASLYTLYLSVWILPVFTLYAFLLNRKQLWRTVSYTLLAGLLYLPWALPAYLQLGRLLRTPDYWVTTRINPVWFLRAMWYTFLPNTRMRLGFLAGVCGGVLLVIFAARRRFKLSERGQRAALVFLTFLIPFVLTYGTVSLAPKFAPRYAIVTAAPLYICIALTLYAVLGKAPISRGLFALLIVAVTVISLRSTIAVVEGHENARDDARGLATYLNENVQASDALLLIENAPYALQYYYRGSAPWYGLHVGQDFAQAADTLNRILLTRPKRVWLILWHREFADPTDMAVTELLRVGQEVEIPQQFFGYRLRAFDIQDYDQAFAAFPTPQAMTNADFEPGLRLLGFDRLGSQQLASGKGQLHYVLYWQAQQRLERNYSLTLSFQDIDGNEYLRKDQALSTDYFLPPVWPVQMPIRGRIDVALPADLPPLTYRVLLKVLDPISQRNLDLVDKHGIALGQALFLEELALPKTKLGAASVQIENPLQIDFGNGLQLLGFGLPESKYSQGDTVRLTLWWQSLGEPGIDHLAYFRLLDSRHYVAWQEAQPILPGHPTTQWQPGEVNRAMYRLALPAHLAQGDYYLQAGTAFGVITLAQLHIAAREHRYQIPPMQQVLGIGFEQGITLLGYDLQAPVVQPEKPITVTLYWQAKQSTAISYKVSAQLLSADMRIVAQDDSIPARWTYPTTAWLPGEVIADEHVLSIKPGTLPGNYTLIVALYDEKSGQRLRMTEEGKTSDHALLTTLRITP